MMADVIYVGSILILFGLSVGLILLLYRLLRSS
jgi:hypothetical protein